MMNLKDREGCAQIARDMDFMCATVGRRLAGSPEEEKVADYIFQRFGKLGLSNIEKLPFSCKCWLPGNAELSVLSYSPSSDQKKNLTIPVQQVTHSPATPSDGVKGELIFFEPIDWENGLRRSDFEGKIGLFLGGYGESARVFRQLHKSKLKALIFVDTRLQTDWPIANGIGEKFMELIIKPMAYISLMDAWLLAQRKVTCVQLTCTGTMKEGTSWNVAGELPGDDQDGQIIVVSGHIDSVAIGQGADDNASGMAAVLECARRLQNCNRRHRVRFIGFGAEEQLSVGSSRYINKQVKDLDRIGFTCNFDGIGAHLGLSTVMCTGTPDFYMFVKNIVEDKLRSEEHTSELQSHSFISYAVFCLKKKNTQ